MTAEDYPDEQIGQYEEEHDADLPPAARRCPPNIRKMVHRAHRNLGHISNHALVRLMTTAKCHVDMIEYAWHLKCPTYLRRRPPDRVPQVSAPYRPTRFNGVVGLDVKWMKDAEGTMFFLLNILDFASTFNLSVLLPNKSSKTISAAFKFNLLQWAGAPEKIVTDQGKEFHGGFKQCASELGSHFRMMRVEVPWQFGMVERHGQVLGGVISATVAETGACGYNQIRDVCLHASMAKNRRPGKTGYSPRSLVYGVDERLAARGLNHYLETPDDAAVENSRKDLVMRKSMEIRKAAMKAVVELDHLTKWAQAIQFPSRSSEVSLLLPGNHVFFWKKQKTQLRGRRARIPARWYGPAIVIGHEFDVNNKMDSY